MSGSWSEDEDCVWFFVYLDTLVVETSCSGVHICIEAGSGNSVLIGPLAFLGNIEGFNFSSFA